MVRFTMTLSSEEAKKIEEMRVWYEGEIGVSVSRNAVIKLLLFEAAPKVALDST
jgi:hypothetical protein